MNKQLQINAESTGEVSVDIGGVHPKIEVYLHDESGNYDNRYGENYVFQF